MSSVFDQIKQWSVIVADTGDFESIRKYQPRDATTNPSLILKAAQMGEYQHVVDRALSTAKQECGNSSALHAGRGGPRSLCLRGPFQAR